MVLTDEEIKLEKISKLLELGGTMLARHCECGAPLFRYKGSIICPICDSNLNKSEETKPENEMKEESAIKPQVPVETVPHQVKVPPSDQLSIPKASVQQFEELARPTIRGSKIISPETSEFIKNSIVNKVVQLSLDLQRETDPSKIKQLMETIESGLRVLNNLNK